MGAGASRGGDAGSCSFFQDQLGELVDFARHEALLRATGEDRATQRAHLEAAAAKGNATAAAALVPPPFPEALAYLWDIFDRLDALRRVGMNGLERLNASDLWAALHLFEWPLAPHEVDALMRLDLATLYPDLGTSDALEADGPVSTIPESQSVAWPEQRA